MSFLHPLFLAALAAVAVPIVLHLSRQRPRRELPFSSLMFLSPTAPRFDRRRRVQDRLLLALRCLALALVALAFARPFLYRPPPVIAAAGIARTAVLVDVSASMRREDLWPRALERIQTLVAAAAPGDRLAVLAFDRRAQTVVGFSDWAALPAGDRASTIAARLAALGPGWGSTDLGRALTAGADAILDDEADARSGGARRVMLVSDLQEGGRLESLVPSAWPPGIEIVVEAILAKKPTNAGLQALSVHGADPAAARRVRITNAAGGSGERFTLRWESGGPPVEAVVPPGTSRVVEVPAPPATGGTLVLEGDDHPFDNRLAVAALSAAHARILYLGEEADDPQGSLYYLRRAFPRTATREVEISAALTGATAAHLLVATGGLGGAAQAARAAVERGRTLLLVLDGRTGAADLRAIAGAAVSVTEGAAVDPSGFVLAEVDTSHPALAPFADPRFADFTKVRFWKRRQVSALPDKAHVVARFDDGSPAWITLPVGKGLVFVMTSGWHPADSQIALSSKFVPLLHGLLDAGGGVEAGQIQVVTGDPVALPTIDDGALRVRKPDGTTRAPAAGATSFGDTDQPGLYTLETGARARTFAVNLAAAESATAPLPVERLEALRRLGATGPRSAGEPAATAARSWKATLEGEQKLWRFLLLLALALAVAETLLAARLSRPAAPGGSP